MNMKNNEIYNPKNELIYAQCICQRKKMEVIIFKILSLFIIFNNLIIAKIFINNKKD